jgi:hypothetical protein
MGQVFLRPAKATDCDIYTKNGDCGGQPDSHLDMLQWWYVYDIYTPLQQRLGIYIVELHHDSALVVKYVLRRNVTMSFK